MSPNDFLPLFGLVFVRSCMASDRPKIAIGDTPTKINMSNEQKQMEIKGELSIEGLKSELELV